MKAVHQNPASKIVLREVKERLLLSKKHITPEEKLKLVIGVSGGEDSSVLLDVCMRLLNVVPLEITVAHVNHGFREESAKEAEFVTQRCEKYGVAIEWYLAPKRPSTENIEAWAREVRYRFFYHVLEKSNSHFIVTAHHQNDQAETVLFRMLTGRLATDAHSIASFERSRKILRPLLFVSKRHIEDYAIENRIPFVSDASNFDISRRRNLLRHELLPWIERNINPQVASSLGVTAERLSHDERYLWKEAEKSEKSMSKDFFVTDCVEVDQSLLWRVLCLRAERLLGENARKVGYQAWLRLIEVLNEFLLNDDKSMKTVELGTSVFCAIDSQGKLTFDSELPRRTAKKSELVEVSQITNKNVGSEILKKTEIGSKVISLSFSTVAPTEQPKEVMVVGSDGLIDQAIICLDAEVVSPAIVYTRTREDGDLIRVFKRGNRKLKKLLNEKRIPQVLKESVPVICAGDEIIWVPGVAKSEIGAPSEDTKRVLVVEFTRTHKTISESNFESVSSHLGSNRGESRSRWQSVENRTV